jgi:integrase
MAVIKVKLRQKSILNNKKSLYLDFYPPIPHPETGEPTRRRFLNMSIFGSLEKGKLDKTTHNKLKPLDQTHDTNTYNIAEGIRQKFEHELNQNEMLSNAEKNFIQREKKAQMKEAIEILKGEENFVTYFKTIAEKRENSNLANWNSAYSHLSNFTNGILKFADLNEQFCNEFKEYLLKTKSIKSSKSIGVKLSQNSAASYFIRFKIALKQAYIDEKISINLNDKITSIPEQEVIKQTLTLEELNLLANAECESPFLKKIVLFSALTGMPFKEMENLKWKNIENSKSFGIRIKMIRQKTNKPYFINISEQAYNLLGEKKEQNENVFDGINNKYRYDLFPKWLAKAGINKVMTFHDLRHTYGILNIDLGTDLYTLQGNMGHSSSRQTTMYAKISDRRKREAANAIKLNI